MGNVRYSVGDIVKLTTDADARSGKVLAVNGILVLVGWANGGATEFSARVLERLTSEPDSQDREAHPCARSKRSLARFWREPMSRSDVV